MEELSFYFSDVLVKNLDSAAKKITRLSEGRICELSILAALAVDFYAEMTADGLAPYDILALLSEELNRVFSKPEPHSDMLTENRKRLLGRLNLLFGADKAVLCELIIEKARERGIDLTLEGLLSDKVHGTDVIYVKNSLSDEAFDVFSQQIPTLKIKYAKSLRDAAIAVASGEVGYCLMPIEEAGNRLTATSSLIIEYDLRINGVTSDFGLDGNSDMKYAILSAKFTVPPIHKADDVYLEIRLEHSDVALYELLSVASTYGYGVYSVNTAAYGTDYCSLVFKDSGEGFLPIILYLTLFTAGYTPVGIYKNLE